MNKCKTCGTNCEKEYCFKHKPRKAIPITAWMKPRRNNDIMISSGVPNGEGVRANIQMQEFFLSIWKERAHKSEISDESLGDEALSIFFHHILPKKKYDIVKFDPENIILLTLSEHESVELNMYKYTKINYLR